MPNRRGRGTVGRPLDDCDVVVLKGPAEKIRMAGACASRVRSAADVHEALIEV
jgi:hypothetical protein